MVYFDSNVISTIAISLDPFTVMAATSKDAIADTYTSKCFTQAVKEYPQYKDVPQAKTDAKDVSCTEKP